MIRFDHITKQYPGTNRPALNSIDVEILRGEFVFLVGASGSGKSSCLRLVLKEEKPTSGSIHVMGQDLRTISNRKVPYFRRNIGVVFQDFRLLPSKSVYENVAFSLQVIGKSRGFIQEAVPDTLQMVGLAEKAQRLPHELSGGEQQRVAIARAIVNKPQILLADEPTGNLDPTTSAGIMALLDRINAGGTTVLMATHEAGIVDQMQRRVIELSAGQIVRDEKRGGYATSAIPIVTSAPAPQAAATPSAATSTAAAQSSAAAQPSAAQPGVTETAVAQTAATQTTTSLADAATTVAAPAPDPSASPAIFKAPHTRTGAVPAVAPEPVAPAAAARFAPPIPTATVQEAPTVPAETAAPAPERAVSTDSGMPFWQPAPATVPVALPATGAAAVDSDAVSTSSTADAELPTGDVPTDARPTTNEGDVERAMTRPVLPIPNDDMPEQLTLAEKLGLRAPGEKPNPTGEQNVGPTR